MNPDLRTAELKLDGVRVRYAEAGAGPPLLFIHGFLVQHEEWRLLLPRLAPHFRCIAPDLPGFGRSAKPPPDSFPYTRERYAQVLRNLLQALGIERASVCGHSMGGGIALTLAADYPETVDRLVIIDSVCYPFSLSPKGKLPLLPVIGGFVFRKLYRKRMFRDYFDKDVFSGHRPLDWAQVDRYYDDFNDPRAREVAHSVLHRTVTDVRSLEAKIPTVRAPTLAVWGEDDRIFPVRLARRLVTELPSASLHLLEGCAHAPNEECPEQTADVVLRHLSGGAAEVVDDRGSRASSEES